MSLAPRYEFLIDGCAGREERGCLKTHFFVQKTRIRLKQFAGVLVFLPAILFPL